MKKCIINVKICNFAVSIGGGRIGGVLWVCWMARYGGVVGAQVRCVMGALLWRRLDALWGRCLGAGCVFDGFIWGSIY